MNPKYMMIDDDNNDDFTGRLNTVKTDSREPYNTVLKHDWLISIGANSIPLHVRTATEKETSIDFWCTNPLSEQTAPIWFSNKGAINDQLIVYLTIIIVILDAIFTLPLTTSSES